MVIILGLGVFDGWDVVGLNFWSCSRCQIHEAGREGYEGVER